MSGPLERPVAPPTGAQRGRSGVALGAVGVTTVTRQSHPRTSVTRATPRRVAELSERLSERDRMLVATLGRLRLACARQLERLHFTESTSLSNARNARRVLSQLTQLDVVARLDRRVGGVRAGSAGYVYALGAAGQHLLGAGGPAGGQIRRPWTPGSAFIRHRLAITELYVGLVEAERRGALEVVSFQAEPQAWRSYSGPGGGQLLLKPDAYAVVAAGDYEHVWFIEVDLATESPAALRRKCHTFCRYRASGREQATGGLFPLVVFLVPTAARADVVRRVIAGLPVSERGVFRVGLLADAAATLAGGAA